MAQATVTRSDIEAKLREIRGEVDSSVARATVPIIAIGAVAVVAVVGLAYFAGRRRGAKRSTVVEVRRG